MSAIRGQPRDDYARTYLLLPNELPVNEQDAAAVARRDARINAWYQAAIDAGAISQRRWTIGCSADDAGIGDLSYRRIIAINPESWSDDLFTFYREHYPGVVYIAAPNITPGQLATALQEIGS